MIMAPIKYLETGSLSSTVSIPQPALMGHATASFYYGLLYRPHSENVTAIL